MSNHSPMIKFDIPTDQVVDFFIDNNIAGFGVLTFSKGKTREILQNFVDGILGNSDDIMATLTDNNIVLTTGNNVVEFGSFINDRTASDDEDSSHAYITSSQTDGQTTITKTIEACPASKETLLDSPDYLAIECCEDDGIVEQTFFGKYRVYKNHVEEITTDGSLQPPIDPCA